MSKPYIFLVPLRAIWMVPLQALQWYRLLRYDGTAYSAMMVPLRRYYQLGVYFWLPKVQLLNG